MKTKRLLTVSLFAITLLLAACAGRNFSWDKARQVKSDMTREEVVAIMGRPTHVTSYSDGRMLYQWIYVDALMGTKHFTVIFQDGVATQVPEVPPEF